MDETQKKCQWCPEPATAEVLVRKGGGRGRTTKIDVWWPACQKCRARLSVAEGVKTRAGVQQ